MNKRKFTKMLHRALKELNMPYYKRNEVEIIFSKDLWTNVRLHFCLPYYSMISIMQFCALNNCSFAISKGGVPELCWRVVKEATFNVFDSRD